MQLSDDWLTQWEIIVNDVEKEHIPLECVKKIVFKLVNSKQKTINLRVLKKQGLDVEDIQNVVQRYIDATQDLITNMEFVLDIEAVAQLLQPETDHLLKNL